jgi:capsular polysaccharide biosynthesis protein
MSEYKNNSELLGLLIKWWKQLAIIAVIAMVVSGIFSSPFIITPKYQSFAVLYPANIIPMGTETQTEQMLQVLESDVIRDSVVSLYHLYEAYQIDPKGKSARAELINRYQENVVYSRTEFQSVVIQVLDENPVQARDMVQSIITFFNSKERSLQQEKSLELVKILDTQLGKKKVEMDSMDAILTGIRLNYGILDYELQTEYATERYLEVISNPSKKMNAKALDPLLNALKEKGGEFMALNEHLWRVRGNYNDLKEQLESAQRDVDKRLTYCNVITNPVVTDKKAYPIRWLIVTVSVLATLLVSILFLALAENLREIEVN